MTEGESEKSIFLFNHKLKLIVCFLYKHEFQYNFDYFLIYFPLIAKTSSIFLQLKLHCHNVWKRNSFLVLAKYLLLLVTWCKFCFSSLLFSASSYVDVDKTPPVPPRITSKAPLSQSKIFLNIQWNSGALNSLWTNSIVVGGFQLKFYFTKQFTYLVLKKKSMGV